MRYKGKKAKAWEAVKARTRRKEKHCYTCPAKWLEGANAQSGHYQPVAIVGSNNTRAWDERFIHLQCSRCNGAGQGMQVSYRRHLVRDYGEEVVVQYDKEVKAKKVSPVKDWDAIIKGYGKMPSMQEGRR